MPVNCQKLDRLELDRIKNLEKKFYSGEMIKGEEIFDSAEITKTLEKGSSLYTPSFGQANASMPSSCLFHSQILIEICPYCSCIKKPKLLKPYLDRKLVLPFLTMPLSSFPAQFSEQIVQTPYVSVFAYEFLRRSWYASSEGVKNKDIQVVCPHCFSNQRKRILRKIDKNFANAGKNKRMKEYLRKCVFPVLYPVSTLNLRMLNYLEEAVEDKNLTLIQNVGHRASLHNTLRMANILNSMPQVAEKDVHNIKSELTKLGLTKEANEIDAKENALHALGLDYDSRISVEEYLDVLMPRRDKVTTLVDSLLINKDKDKIISSINDEIWKINEELSSSKKVEMLTYTSDFVFGNSGLLFSLLVGGIIGYSSGSFLGCGIGSGLGSLSAYVGSKVMKKRLKFPKYPKRTMEWLKVKIEDPQEKILAAALSKDIRVIQIWNLKKKLKKDV